MGKTIDDYSDLVKEKHALNKTIAPTETNETDASRAYAVGEQLIFNGTLYDVIAPISQHDVITTTGSGANIAPAGPISAKIQTLKNNIKARAEVGAYNLLDINSYTNIYNLSIANNGITNTATDTRAANIWIGMMKGGTSIGSALLNVTLQSTGVQEYTFTIPNDADFDILSIGHNGATKDLKVRVPFNHKGTFKIIFDATGIDASTVGGYSLTNIMICLATDVDLAFQLYAMTNRELTETLNKRTNLTASNLANGVTLNGDSFFIKIGKLCVLHVNIKVPALSTGTGTILISGLPASAGVNMATLYNNVNGRSTEVYFEGTDLTSRGTLSAETIFQQTLVYICT